MKRILLLITVVLIIISPVFALTDEADSQVDIDALVDEIDYSLKLYYDSQELTDESVFSINSTNWILNDSAVVTKTDNFVLEASGGNIFTPQRVTVTISPTSFIGTLDNNEEYVTDIIPEIRGVDGRVLRNSIINTETNVTTVNTELPAGFQETDVNLLSFIFQWTGDSILPSGRYVSNIIISYKVI